MQPLEEAAEADLVQIGLGHVLAQRRVDLPHIVVALEIAAGAADDPALGQQLAVEIAVVEAGQQLAAREIAGAAEDHEVEGLDGNDLGGHGGALPRAGPAAGRSSRKRWTRSRVGSAGIAPRSVVVERAHGAGEAADLAQARADRAPPRGRWTRPCSRPATKPSPAPVVSTASTLKPTTTPS